MKMSYRITIAVCGVLLVLSAIGIVKGLQIGRMVAHSQAFQPPPQTVAAAEVQQTQWEATLSAVGSLEAVQGVVVSAELAGKVSRIAFSPGARVSAGDLLVQQDVTEERARLRSAQSETALARKNLDRAMVLRQQDVIPQADLDERKANYDKAAAEIDNILAVIEKKTIRAPFSGRLGIRQINMGEVLESGQPIVSLQTMDPIYVNFQLPQQRVDHLKVGYSVRADIQSIQTNLIQGTITALNPEVDPTTRNLTVQATLNNIDERLRPGMYANVNVVLPVKQEVLAIPATAILHAPYGDSVFILEPQDNGSEAMPQVLRQQFVRLGEQRGDYIAVLDGLEAGQTIVSTGVFKLRNGMAVVVDNNRAPDFELNPNPTNA